MRWTEVQDYLSTEHMAARIGWKEDAYVELANDDLIISSMSDPEGVPYTPDAEDSTADDWFVVGIA